MRTTQGKGSRESTFGSIVLGVYDQNGDIHEVGEVGTGFKKRDLAEISAMKFPFTIEVNHSGLSKSAKLRFPIFKGIRHDISFTDKRAIGIDQFIGIPVTT